MKQFRNILGFELKNYLRSKAFVGITLFLMLLITVIMFFPRISEAISSKEESQPTNQEELAVMLLSADPQNAPILEQAFSAVFSDYEVQLVDADEESLREQINAGKAECAFHIKALNSYTYYVNNLSMYDRNTETADEILQQLYRVSAMEANGIPTEEAMVILASPITHETVPLGKDQMQNFFYTYAMIFALYMVILLYGQMVASNVASEKSSRAMEVLITSARPVAMMFGKVIASCIAGLLQLTAVFGSAYLFFNLNKNYWKDNMIINSLFNMPLELLIYMLIFFILGFFLYAFLYGAIGSTATKLEDINTSCTPLTMLFIIAFMVVIFSMTSGSVDNTAMRVCSYIPFTSPMSMFTRIAMSTVPLWEILISIGILIASVIGVGVLSAKIYRVGVLLYGTPPRIGAIIKAIRKA